MHTGKRRIKTNNFSEKQETKDFYNI